MTDESMTERRPCAECVELLLDRIDTAQDRASEIIAERQRLARELSKRDEQLFQANKRIAELAAEKEVIANGNERLAAERDRLRVELDDCKARNRALEAGLQKEKKQHGATLHKAAADSQARERALEVAEITESEASELRRKVRELEQQLANSERRNSDYADTLEQIAGLVT